jgi:sugar transferase EpsL
MVPVDLAASAMYARSKRIFDVIGSLIAAVVFAPVFFIIAICVRLSLGRPILFWHVRAGLHGKPFRLVKFRTMREAFDQDGTLLADSARLTQFGIFIRSTSMDELPELWNVLRGDMSLVGPRPLLMEYLPYYSVEQSRRQDVLPGITGWAQVNGRNAISWEEKFNLDVWYVDNRNIWLDIKVLFRTVAKLLQRADISATGHATMPAFGPRKNSNDTDHQT